MDINIIELLISEIHKRDVLWNKRNKKFKDRHVTSKAWSEVSKKVGMTGKQIIIIINYIKN